MKQGKRKTPAAESSAAATAGPELPDAAYVDQLLGNQCVEQSGEQGGDLMSNQASEQVSKQAASSLVELPAQCLLRDAVEYRQRLLDCMALDSVTIDVGAVDRIDTAFIQVLLAFARSRAAARRPIVWQRLNTEFTASVRLLGVQAPLSIPDESVAA